MTGGLIHTILIMVLLILIMYLMYLNYVPEIIKLSWAIRGQKRPYNRARISKKVTTMMRYISASKDGNIFR